MTGWDDTVRQAALNIQASGGLLAALSDLHLVGQSAEGRAVAEQPPSPDVQVLAVEGHLWFRVSTNVTLDDDRTGGRFHVDEVHLNVEGTPLEPVYVITATGPLLEADGTLSAESGDRTYSNPGDAPAWLTSLLESHAEGLLP